MAQIGGRTLRLLVLGVRAQVVTAHDVEHIDLTGTYSSMHPPTTRMAL